MAGQVKQESSQVNPGSSIPVLVPSFRNQLLGNPQSDKELLNRMASCQFIQKKGNILITGLTGVGKSFIASALGHQACAMGYRVVYHNPAKLFTRLHGARADNSLYKEIARIEKQDLLILDDFGLQNLDKSQRDLLMEIIEDRHNKQATISHLNYR